MRKPSTVFASLFLSLMAGMVVSEAASYLFDRVVSVEARGPSQQSAAEVAGLALPYEAVN